MRRGFTLLELIVVLAVTLVLTGILLPSLSSVQEHARRMVSQSNMRQQGIGFTMYATDSGESLPLSALVHVADGDLMQEMMAVRFAKDDQLLDVLDPYHSPTSDLWEGFGLLFGRAYLDTPKVFYSPSHTGGHTWERYNGSFGYRPNVRIYSNYHYRGDYRYDFESDRLVRMRLDIDSHRVFLTDGMRTAGDLNHHNGYNVLYGNGAVEWRGDPSGQLQQMLPQTTQAGEEVDYAEIWRIIDEGGMGQ